MLTAKELCGVGVPFVRLCAYKYPFGEFIRILNEGYPNEPLNQPHRFSGTQHIDRVVIGQSEQSFPLLADCVTIRTHFKRFLENKTTGTTLLIIERGDGYSEKLKQAIRRSFPNMTWLIPETRDYFDQILSVEVADDLKKAGILCGQ